MKKPDGKRGRQKRPDSSVDWDFCTCVLCQCTQGRSYVRTARRAPARPFPLYVPLISSRGPDAAWASLRRDRSRSADDSRAGDRSAGDGSAVGWICARRCSDCRCNPRTAPHPQTHPDRPGSECARTGSPRRQAWASSSRNRISCRQRAARAGCSARNRAAGIGASCHTTYFFLLPADSFGQFLL